VIGKEVVIEFGPSLEESKSSFQGLGLILLRFIFHVEEWINLDGVRGGGRELKFSNLCFVYWLLLCLPPASLFLS